MTEKILKTIKFVKEKLQGAEAGHDWFHVERVWKLSQKIAVTEGGNLEIIELSALLHDIADPKFHGGNETLALEISEQFLNSIEVSKDVRTAVLFIIQNISFKNSFDSMELSSNYPKEKETSLKELKIVQDADRLDAIGAIGIARTFNFGGYKNNLMYHPEILPNLTMNKEEYKKSNGTTINHFYEKLLLLKDKMNTETAKKIASERHDFMLKFLEEFYKEWNVE